MEYYIEAIKKYAVFEGRTQRRNYWYFVLFNLIISIVISLVEGVIGLGDMAIISGLYTIFMILPGLAIGVRRLHDIDKSGWWILLGLIPFVGAIILLIFFVMDSKPGANKYGPNPKGVEVAPEAPASQEDSSQHIATAASETTTETPASSESEGEQRS